MMFGWSNYSQHHVVCGNQTNVSQFAKCTGVSASGANGLWILGFWAHMCLLPGTDKTTKYENKKYLPARHWYPSTGTHTKMRRLFQRKGFRLIFFNGFHAFQTEGNLWIAGRCSCASNGLKTKNDFEPLQSQPYISTVVGPQTSAQNFRH